MTRAGNQAGVPLEDRDRLEELLIELSARFINLPSERVDSEIEAGQRRICEHLGMDRSSLWQPSSEDPDTMVMTHIYQDSRMPASPVLPDARDLFPWVLQQVRRGEIIALAGIDDLPAEAARDRESWRRLGTNSTVVIPLITGGIGFGALTFASARVREFVPASLVKRLKMVADVFGHALARAHNERALKESRERFARAVDGSSDGLWDWDMLTGEVYFSPRWKSMLGYEEHEVGARLSSWEELIHPEDRERARTTLKAFVEGGAPEYELEHRLRCRDGSYRWILARGKVQRDPEGRPCRMSGAHTDISQLKQTEASLKQALAEVKLLQDRLQQENAYLREEVQEARGPGTILGHSRSLKHVLIQARQVAPTDSTVLLLGETGTGKELIASAIHELSPRRGRTMVRVNCAAIPASLLESELFGREKGAYTGALSRQIGRFEMANGSTLFLDEIGDLPPELQTKLLRVLQEKQIERLGSSKTIDLDVRIITATNRNLEKAVRAGHFREDLYYRLNVFAITVPPLRDRREDIPVLTSALVARFAARFGKNIESIAVETMEALQRYDWPGNVRELQNVIERAMIVAKGPRLWIEPPGGLSPESAPSLTMKEAEEQHIRKVLDLSGWRVRGRNGAAERLGLKPSTLESRMAKLGIRRPDTEPT